MLIYTKDQAQTVTDYDGNVYQIVTVGSQQFIDQNLKVTHYNNGDIIPNISDNLQWNALTGGAYCNYDNDVNNGLIYGRLYNWYAITDSRKICPNGWHIPTLSEWDILIGFLGGNHVAGGKMKETGTLHWKSPNSGATNESGLTGLPAGHRYYDGYFFWLTESGSWWAPIPEHPDSILSIGLNYSWPDAVYLLGAGGYKQNGFSVRCMNYSTGLGDINYSKQINIFPNPAFNIICINGVEEQSIKISIYNLVGEIVLQKDLINHNFEIDITTLLKGLYIISIISGH